MNEAGSCNANPNRNDVQCRSTISNERYKYYNFNGDSSDSQEEDPVYITPPPVEPQIVQGYPPLEGAPPTYSAIMRIGPDDPCLFEPPNPYPRPPILGVQPSPPFIAPPPPPSYAQSQGVYMDVPAAPSLEQVPFGPQPISVICPRCTAIVTTQIRTTQSNLTHISALTLCICGCWPCCLLPYCMGACKNTVHQCPRCHIIIGRYHPW